MNKESAVKVIPAILPKSFREVEEKVAKVAPFVSWIQIDAVDGMFAPNKTWPYTGDDDGHFAKIIGQEEGFPGWDEVSMEADLMVANPAFEADKWIAAGAARIVIHLQSIGIEQFEILAKNIKEKGVELVLGIEMDVSLAEMHPYVIAAEDNGGLDGIQCMGIDKEGFQHQKFDPAVIKKVEEIRAEYPHTIITVDGGVSLENAAALHEAGATKLVCGSAIFDAASPEAVIAEIADILE
jgi:ribulose-phosphate 3-epimerase